MGIGWYLLGNGVVAQAPGGSHQAILDLQDCVSLALQRNFVVRYHLLEQDKKTEQIRDLQGSYDPQLGAYVGRSSEQTLRHQDGSVDQTDRLNEAEVSLSGQTPVGTRYQIGLRNQTNRSRGIDTFYLESQPSATIQVMQPILKGGIRNEARTALQLSRKGYEVEAWKFQSIVIQTVAGIIDAYADLYLASQQLAIAINNRDLAAQLLEDNQKRVSLGYQSESDIILAESRSIQREEAVFQAELNLHYQQNRLKQLISDEMMPLLDTELAIAELPELPQRLPVVAQDFGVALHENPLFRMAQIGIDIQELILLQKQFNLLPSLDFTLRYDQFGIGADTSAGWDSLGNRQGENWYGGLQFSIPITHRSARAQRAMATIELRQSELELERIRQAVLLQLDNEAFRVKSNWDRMRSSQHNRELAEQSLLAEEKKLKAGRSTSFFVLDQQQRLADAQLQEIRSRIDYFKSLSSYQKENGTLLKAYAIDVPQSNK